MEKGVVYHCPFAGDWVGATGRLLDRAGLAAVLDDRRPIVLKPNLVKAAPPPITTPVALVAALVDYLQRARPGAEIIVAEGCGAKEYDTDHCFTTLGYAQMAMERGVKLIDLNQAPLTRLSRPQYGRWPEMHLPTLLLDAFLISLPVLKAHTLAKVTLTMKNMMGAAPPACYQQGGHWKKAAFHQEIQAAVADLNRYRCPDFTLLDATIGLSKSHLGGPLCRPSPGLLAASFDPVAIDAFGAGLLGHDWQTIGHIRSLDGELGRAHPLKLIKLEPLPK
ncbi:DUF362 domain-containing protein [Desulfurivibrio sp. D14AmB]|uniref:DUF362 domain-containing protein n=1 Tax=Desulfurivibrio sp. D14AmB TaxID=3374370 RepID=UPI00376F3AF6